MPSQLAAVEWDARFSRAAEALWQARVARVERQQQLARAAPHQSPPSICPLQQPPACARGAEPSNARGRDGEPAGPSAGDVRPMASRTRESLDADDPGSRL